jgi:predicted acyltransferase (DUF342 family)
MIVICASYDAEYGHSPEMLTRACLLQDYRLQPQALQGLTAVGELAAIGENKTLIGDVKNHRLRFCVVRVLNKLQCHDIIALKSRQVASDVSKQVRGVRATAAWLGLLIRSYSCFIPDSAHSLRIVAAPIPGN